MNDAQTAGGSSPLEVHIAAKTFRAAGGGSVEAVRGLAFAVPPASITALIGPSGCGKTTTLRAILGLDTDFQGTIRLPRPDARIAAVFQEPRLLPWRTLAQNVALVLPDGAPPERVAAALAEVELADAGARYPGELSLGMARRAALARALAVEPEVLILDEPFVSLDPPTAARLRELVARIFLERRMTVVIVTHDLDEAIALADRLVLLSPRPAHVVREVEVALPGRPRDAATVMAFRQRLGL